MRSIDTDTQRREFLAGVAGAGAAGLLWSPSARAGRSANADASATGASGHDAYFAALNELLKREGPGRPVMMLDLDRVDRNIDQLAASVGPEKQYRVVVKSLPSVPLLERVMMRARTDALMVFHQPFLNEVARSFPNASALLGKPMPVSGRENVLRLAGGREV